jgi:large subunit ribosomal protein L1
MKKGSKRYQKSQAKVDINKQYTLEEAIGVLKTLEPTKFDQTVELVAVLGIDPKKSEQQIRGSLSLPNGIGKTRKVIVFAEGEEAKAAQAAGADEVGSAELIKKVGDGWMEFDVALAVPYMMKQISKLGKVLGPQGKMPSPKSGTVTEKIADAVKEFKAGKIEFRADATGVVHAPAGKLSFSAQALKDNLQTLIDYLIVQKPASAKGIYMKKLAISATMSPGLKLKMLQ